MIAHKLGFGGNGWKPALAQAPINMPSCPNKFFSESLGQSGALNMLFTVGAIVLASVFAYTIIQNMNAKD